MSGGRSTNPSTWHCIVAAWAAAARSHQRALRVVHARQAAVTASALVNCTRLGFQRNVDSSTAVAETAMRKPAVAPATNPPTARASDATSATASTPRTAISPTTIAGSPLPSQAAGASR